MNIFYLFLSFVALSLFSLSLPFINQNKRKLNELNNLDIDNSENKLEEYYHLFLKNQINYKGW